MMSEANHAHDLWVRLELIDAEIANVEGTANHLFEGEPDPEFDRSRWLDETTLEAVADGLRATRSRLQAVITQLSARLAAFESVGGGI